MLNKNTGVYRSLKGMEMIGFLKVMIIYLLMNTGVSAGEGVVYLIDGLEEDQVLVRLDPQMVKRKILLGRDTNYIIGTLERRREGQLDVYRGSRSMRDRPVMNIRRLEDRYLIYAGRGTRNIIYNMRPRNGDLVVYRGWNTLRREVAIHIYDDGVGIYSDWKRSNLLAMVKTQSGQVKMDEILAMLIKARILE